MNSGEIHDANSKAISRCANVAAYLPCLLIIPIAPVDSIHLFGVITNPLSPASFLIASNSRQLKFGLCNASHRPIKDHLIPPELTPEQIGYKYANEADMLNVVLFGKTAKQWRDANPGKKGNIRDEANLNQLLVLANMESYNAILIGQGKTMSERIVLLRELAVKQMETLSMVNMDNLKRLPGDDSE